MESINELRKLCEKRHTKGVSRPNLYAKLIIRKISIYLTWLLLHTSISANQVTIVQLVSTLIGAAFIIPINMNLNLIGVFLLQLGYVFDNIDGEIARYRKKTTVNGLYIDLFNHLVMIPFVFIGLGFHYYFLSGKNFIFVLLAVLGGFSIFNPTKRAIWAMIYYLTEKCGTPSYNYKNLRSITSGDRLPRKNLIINKSNNLFYNSYKNLLNLIFGYPNCVNIYSIMILAECIFKEKLYMVFFLIYISMGVFQILRESVAFVLTIKYRKPEKQFQTMLDNLKKAQLL